MIRLYYATYRLLPASYRLLKLLAASHLLLRAVFSGIWLGLLRRETLLEINSDYYSRSKKYTNPNYNKSGLLPWESAMIAAYFQNCKRLLLVGAGGGREVLALRQLGYEVHGFECNSELVRVANALLAGEATASVQFAPPGTCPTRRATYDGLIVGWGAYMLIQGRDNRTALLRKMRAQVSVGAPLLVSFFFRSPDARRFLVTKTIGNALRRLLGRENDIEVGDALEPEYVHYFTPEEIAEELREGGFALEHYREDPYGHAVGLAS